MYIVAKLYLKYVEGGAALAIRVDVSLADFWTASANI